MKVSTEIDNNFGYEKITQLVDNIPLSIPRTRWVMNQIKALLHGKQVSRYLYHATFCIMILVSLHTKSSSMFHAEFVYKLFRPKWRILTRHYHRNWPNNITTFFPFPFMFYLPCADHVLLFVDDVVTSWPQTKISDLSEIKCIVILAVQNRTCSIPKCVSCNF